MSRSNYHDDCHDTWALIRWRGAVNSAARGARGQQLFREMLAALDAMPDKALIAHELEAAGRCCALGVVGRVRGVPLAEIDPEDYERVAKEFNIAEALAREVVFMNDEAGWYDETPEDRWVRVRAWVAAQIVEHTPQLALPTTIGASS